jgi:hypothetical protein
MKLSLSIASILSFCLLSAAAEAKEDPKPLKALGVQLDVGIPNGVGLSFITRPIHWAHLNFGGTYNGMAPGMFAGLTLDPIKFPIVPTLTGELGGSWRGHLIGVKDAPDLSYIYANLWPGIEFGGRDSWRIFVRAGVSWISGTVYDAARWTKNSDNTISFSNPHFSATVAPTGKLGFLFYF